jgi:DNA topoisomerase-2
MATRKYQKHTHHQHILELPDTYIGSTKTNEETRWTYDAATNKMVWRKGLFNPGLFKIFDEIIVNARDEYVRATVTAGMTPVKHIAVTVMTEGGETVISVENDGDGIPIEMNEEHKMMIPQLIFGNLLTSSNYDKSEEKIVGGKHGYGQKCLSPDTKVILWSAAPKPASDIVRGDVLIGDDGTPRTVTDVVYGEGQMFEVQQINADPYVVNDEHLLTLHMPDHKVITWAASKNAWLVLWWNHKEQRICSKSEIIERLEGTVCEVCNTRIASNMARHYRRCHPTEPIPTLERKGPTKGPAEETEESLAARARLEEFCKTIPDCNVFDMSIRDYMALNVTTKKRLAGVRGESIQWPHRDVALDPYVLGLWLGDGMANGYRYTCYGDKDPQIIDYLTEWGKKNDATITKKGKYVYQLSSIENFKKKGSAPLKKLLEKYNLVENKHIPAEYLFNDRATRLSVLAGLIDTDGHVGREGTRINITQGLNHTRLAHDIVFLARSLGLNCQIHRMPTTWTYKGEKRHGEAWSMNISGYGAKDIPTLLPRKKCADPVQRNTSKSTGYLTINDHGIGPYVGIKIDGNERFLINDFTVTHNCSNIFSSRFQIDLKTPAAGKHYMQTWRDNMYTVDPPTVKKYTGKTGAVKVTFVPDRTRFPGMFDEKGIIPEMVDTLHTRVIELAALVGKDVKVSWNGTVIASNSFEKFIKLFLRDGMTGFAYENCGPRWEVGAVLSSHLYSDEEELPEEKHISFVNGVHTKKGGKHVETVTRKVLGDFCEFAKKKKVDIKPGQLKHSVVLFLAATIVNPSFDSQSKEFLTTPAAEFGSRAEYSGKLIEGLHKLGLLEEAKYVLEAKNLREVKKTDGKKRSVLRGMTKLEDAMLAGTSKSRECTLILTEGDSAATSAISGLKEVGRERWGVFPLRGKLLNVRDITVAKFNANEELTAIKKILGLEQGKRYADSSELRYGRVMVMADQDHDGSHIKGLLMNLFHAEWPTLMQSGFLCTLLTPILKATKGAQTVAFYSLPEFNQWREAMMGSSSGVGGWKFKYYKGLGTSTPAEAREWFRNIHEIQYEWDDKTDGAINLAFNKKLADDRKLWLGHYDPKKMITVVAGKTTYADFVDNELIHFSNADNIRSLPHVMDGLKPSQRKILFCCIKRNLKEEIRVAQLAGYVSEHAAYHHGEASLTGTIIGMAQNFVGSNNVNLLKPVGQFGSRLVSNGADAASPRYIHTYLEEITGKIFRKEDAGLLKFLEEDGESIEPEYYLPVVPLLAINGSVGIGTGYSTDIPPHRPEDIVSLLRARLDGTIDTLADRPLDPWWFGFRGTTHRKDESTWITKGLYELDEAKRTVTITELPVGTWTKNYKEFLDALLDTDDKKAKEAKKDAKKAETGSTASAGKKDEEPVGLKSFDDLYNDVDVRFVLHFTEEGFDAVVADREGFEKRFKLTSSWKTTNMTCFDTEFNIVKYKTVGDLVEAFVDKRLPMYDARRTMMLDALARQMVEMDAKRRFIQAILDGRLVLQRQTEEAIVAGLKACAIPALTNMALPDEYDSYEYVLRMRIDRVKEAAVIELDRQLAEKRGEIAVLEGQTGAGLWLADLAEFEEAWRAYTVARIESATSVASSGAPVVKAVRKKPVAGKK